MHVSDATTGSGMKLLGSLIAERKVLRSYAPSSTVVTLADTDLTAAPSQAPAAPQTVVTLADTDLTAVKLTVDDLVPLAGGRAASSGK